MALIAAGFTRLLSTGIPYGETLLSVTAVSDHVVWLSHRLQLFPAHLHLPLTSLPEAKKTHIGTLNIMGP